MRKAVAPREAEGVRGGGGHAGRGRGRTPVLAGLAALALAVAAGLLAAPAPKSAPREVPLPKSYKPLSGDQPPAFFMGRLKYGQNQGMDCGNVGQDLIKLVSSVLTVRVQEERRLSPADAQLYETPFLFMNGHNDFVLSKPDLESLRIYFQHGGFLLSSDCCSNPAFPKAWRREFARIFPEEPIKKLPYDHPIYRSFYKLEKIPCLHEKREVYLEGLFWQGNLVAVLCSDGLCCAFSMDNTCNKGRGVSPEDGKKLAINIAVYAMTH